MPSETLTIELPAETAGLLREVVASGTFGDAGAVVDAALQGWIGSRDDLLGWTEADLRRLGDAGETSGPGELTLEQVQREGFRRAGVPFPAE